LQYVGTAADLAVFYIVLNATGGLIYRSLVPFAAARALEAGIHSGHFSLEQKTSSTEDTEEHRGKSKKLSVLLCVLCG
jgi:hypothetical protein